ncbi:hypothetical protein TH63_02650 [Rufibacter radiotolerans]|uniref:Glycosyltransferase RgtA/B/C/D-like domain-containing protein n=1 Tax=Rufibacter radiotolerans TaxID=1379910 RepID=A0A0H4VGN9_9BACT|nr:hypothetical protein [Rufibacter radiotolerans]AKQ44770.1 hypothetical protein TH63_02650 [Rufibacter radiotolerans]
MRFLSRDSTFALFFTVVYALLLAWFMPFHELWFDETEPWLLALYSNSYPEMLYNKRYEGHPNLWYSLLYGLTHFTQNLKALQLTQATFATGFVYVFLRHAPFSRVLKLCFCFGYYGLFEYGIISRLYALEMLSLFLICTLYPKRFSHWYLYVALLALHAQTNLFGFFMAGILGLLLFSEAFRFWKNSLNWLPTSVVQKTAGILIWGVACLFSFWSMFRPNETDGSFFNFFHLYYFWQAAARPWQAFFPLPNFNVFFWNTSFLQTRMEIPLSVLLLLLVSASLYPVKRLLLGLILLCSALLFLFTFKMEGSMRHHGHFFIFSIVLLWLKTYYYPTDKPSLKADSFIQKFSSLLTPVLLLAGVVQVIAGAFALYIDWKNPFYGGKEVNEFLKTVPATSVIATAEVVTTSNVTAYYGKQIYNLPTGNYRSFYTLDHNDANDLRPYILLDWALALAQQKNAPVILICRTELPYQWASFPVTYKATFRGKYVNPYAFFIYEIQPFQLPKKTMMAEYPVSLKP